MTTRTDQDQAKLADAHAIAKRAADRLTHLAGYNGFTAINSIEFDIVHRLLHSLSDLLAMLEAAPAEADPAADPRLVREFKLEAELAASQERVRELEGEFEQFKIDGGKAIQFNRERAEKAEQERDALANALARLHLDTRMLLAGKPVRDIDEALIEAQCALDAMKPVSSEMDSPNK